MKGCAVAGLHSAIGPAPLALRTKGHVGLDLDPIRARAEDRSRSEVYGEGGADHRDWLVQSAVNLRARKSAAVGVNEDIPIGGRSRAIEIQSIGVDRLDIPSLTSRHDKVVGEIGAEGGKVGKRRGQAGRASSIVVLIVENYLRSSRRARNGHPAYSDGGAGDWECRYPFLFANAGRCQAGRSSGLPGLSLGRVQRAGCSGRRHRNTRCSGSRFAIGGHDGPAFRGGSAVFGCISLSQRERNHAHSEQ